MAHQARFLALLAAFLLLAGLIPAVSAQETHCPPGQSPRFVFGFADLKAHVGAAMGEPLTCEFPDPNGTGDIHQRTSTGLAFWRKSTNTPTFTNGWEHWGRTPEGWVTWVGSSIDPPGVLPPPVAATPPPPSPAPAPPPVTYDTPKGPRTETQLRDELAAAGYAGPWDVESMLAAYSRAADPSLTPSPTSPPPAATPTPQDLDPALRARCVQFGFTLASALAATTARGSDTAGRMAFGVSEMCFQLALEDGAAGVSCFELAVLQSIRLGVQDPDVMEGLYRYCMGR